MAKTSTKKVKKQEADEAYKLPENKFGIKVVNDESERVYETFGITKERWNVLKSGGEEIIRRLLHLDKTGKRDFNVCDITMEIAAICDTPTELATLVGATLQSIERNSGDPISQFLDHLVNH